MKFLHSKQLTPALLAFATLTASHCMVGKYPPDEHNRVAKPFIYDSAVSDPFGVLLAGISSVKQDQVYNLSEEMLEGGSETPLISALPDYGADALARQVSLHEAVLGPFTAPVDSDLGFAHDRLPPELWTEFHTVLNRAERAMFRLQEEKPHESHPLMYIEQLGLLLYGPMVLDYAPPNDRYAAIIQRLHKTPDYLRTARETLRSSSELRITAAREATQGVINLIRNEVADSIPASMRAGFDSAARDAVAGLEAYRNSLSDLPTTGRVARGRHAAAAQARAGNGTQPGQHGGVAQGDARAV